jgi:hypothetical protein
MKKGIRKRNIPGEKIKKTNNNQPNPDEQLHQSD